MCKLPTEKGGHPNPRQGPFDKVFKPGGETNPIDHVSDPVVIDRVEGLGCVKEKEETVKLALDSLKEERVDLKSVVTAIFPDQKTFLNGTNVAINSRHDATGNSRGKKPVVGVSNTEGAGVGEEARLLFRKEKKDPEVEPLGGEVTFKDSPESPKKNRSSKVRGGPPGRVGDTIGTGGGVVGPLMAPRMASSQARYRGRGRPWSHSPRGRRPAAYY